jgi:dTDP-4-dehydrorhamnose 3,5-epimerase
MKRLLSCETTDLNGVYLVKRTPFRDERGQFERIFCAQELLDAGWRKPAAQINLSHSVEKGTVRGLHYQFGDAAECKLVSCIAGHVWDVVVDLRTGSPTYLQWRAFDLSVSNAYALMIPEGVAHGFQALAPESTLLYVHSMPYTPTQEAGIRADDRQLNISWPIAFSNWSQRDRDLLPLAEIIHAQKGISVV